MLASSGSKEYHPSVAFPGFGGSIALLQLEAGIQELTAKRGAMTTPLYVPILKGKEGEYAALEMLEADVRLLLRPLIEIPGVPYDYVNERPAKSLEVHVAGIHERLRRCCMDSPVYLDMPWFGEEERIDDGGVAIGAVLTKCGASGVNAVPVVSRASSKDYLAACGGYSATGNAGSCIRLYVEDFEEEIDLHAEVDRLLTGLGVDDATQADLIIDLEDLGRDASRAVLVARSVFSMIPRAGEWRHLILAAASFTEALSDVDAATTSTLPRHEWDLWRTLQRRPNLLPRRDLIFGDYAISHPIPKELDPRTMRMSANIRYTARENWLVVKGRNVRQYGFDQFFDLCQTIIQRQEYCGRDFSWGDEYIAECASKSKGPGNATTWRKVGVNHHLTLLAREIARLRRGA